MTKISCSWDRTGWLVLAFGSIACGIDNGGDGQVIPAPSPAPPTTCCGEAMFQRVVPVDDRAAHSAERPPAPISGGTLLVTRDGELAVAADSQRDRVSIVRLDEPELAGVVELEPGDEPGRVVEDDEGRLHVVLRRAGAIASIDRNDLTLAERRAVCAAPRGILAQGDELHVACAEGKLVTLPLTGTPATRVVSGLPNDLRDVVAQGSDLIVSRFRSAELLRINAGGTLLKTYRLPDRASPTFVDPNSNGAVGDGNAFRPAVAWRVTTRENGDVVVVHQLARTTPISLDPPEEFSAEPAASPYGGGGSVDTTDTAVVHSAITVMKSDGRMEVRHFGNVPLPVDLTETSLDNYVVAAAGAFDASAPIVSFVGMERSSAKVVLPRSPIACGVFHTGPDVNENDLCGALAAANALRPQTVAVAANPRSPEILVTQTYDPSAVNVFRYDALAYTDLVGRVSLGDELELDSGHAMFHRATTSGLACASCHPEGGDDGVVWTFTELGRRRTQPLDVGLDGTAPFHWEGEHADLGSLLEDTFVSRMGGVHESPERTAALKAWLFQPRTPRPPELDAAATERGRTLFEGEAGCVSCHSGPKFTNNQSYDVRNASFSIPPAQSLLTQVPSLLGVGYRTRFMHDGCASQLEQRFEPTCGGASHGNTSKLSKEQIGDLIVYLKSL